MKGRGKCRESSSFSMLRRETISLELRSTFFSWGYGLTEFWVGFLFEICRHVGILGLQKLYEKFKIETKFCKKRMLSFKGKICLFNNKEL